MRAADPPPHYEEPQGFPATLIPCTRRTRIPWVGFVRAGFASPVVDRRVLLLLPEGDQQVSKEICGRTIIMHNTQLLYYAYVI